jgi:hypothetical protein
MPRDRAVWPSGEKGGMRRWPGNGRGLLWPRRLALAEAKASEARFDRECVEGHRSEAESARC